MPEPLQPLDVRPLFAPLGAELVALLRGLDAADFERPTVAPKWRVRDVAAHLLDSGLRRLAFGRDRMTPPPPNREIRGYADLVGFLDHLNAIWVEASRRLSPRLLVDLLEQVEGWLDESFAAQDLGAPALFPVSWAGEEESKAWFDLARELTERWHHQQQIRDAVGAPLQFDPPDTHGAMPDTWGPVLETFLRVLPHAYRDLDAEPGAALSLAIERPLGAVDLFTLERGADLWTLGRSPSSAPAAHIHCPAEAAWHLLTKSSRRREHAERVRVSGDARLAEPFFEAVAVMA